MTQRDDTKIALDPRPAQQVVSDLLARRGAFVPEWRPTEAGADAALAQIVARYIQTIAQRLNQAPDKQRLAFFDLLGVKLITAQAARAPVVFGLAEKATDAQLPAGTRVAAPPPPGSSDQVIFETEQALGVAAARLKEVFSVWPGRDQYINHSQAVAAKQPFQPFDKRQLQDTPHALYLAHDTLLALAGQSRVDVSFDLTTPGSEPLDILWEYWDGKVWRQFRDMRAQCGEETGKLDGTGGLTRSGTFRLETDCAQTDKTKVNGIESFWIRGRLNQPLPPDPARVLPEADRILLSTHIARPLTLAWSAQVKPLVPVNKRGLIVVRDEAGSPLGGVKVEISSKAEPNVTDFSGVVELPINEGSSVTVAIGEFREVATVPVDISGPPEVTFTLTTDGLEPDKAASDGLPVDVTKPFFPFGQQAQPGSAFYFTNQEVFSKPGARVRIYVQTAETGQDLLGVTTSGTTSGTTPGSGGGVPPSRKLAHTVGWEYWNGERWTPLLWHTNRPDDPTDASAEDFTGTGLIDLELPRDMASTKVNNQDGLWIRVRLTSGSYGFTQTVPITGAQNYTYVVPRPPVLSKFLLGYTWEKGPYTAERAFAHNDFQYIDRTEEAKWPGNAFQPFTPPNGTPALYLGFDKPLPVDRIGILFDVVEAPGEVKGPALRWEYWDGINWQDTIVEDETQNLRLPGIVDVIGPDDSRAVAAFDTALHWLRGRLKEDGPPGQPTINAVYLNAVWAAQHLTVLDDPLGASTGEMDQLFTFRQIPVLAGEQIEVRELVGLRANVEWRIIARELFGGSVQAIADLEAMLARDGVTGDVQKGDLRLVRDRTKRVTEVWVRWHRQPHLFLSGPDARHYVIDRARGRLLFGNGKQAKIPPQGAAIFARRYRTVGGAVGNVPALAISQLLVPAGGIEQVYNPRRAEGGADGETPEMLARRAPGTLRHRGRALAPADYETMAREASPAVGRAWVVPATGPGGRATPGWVTLVIVPKTLDRQPWPSFGLREEVRRFVEGRCPAEIAGGQVYVTGPSYQLVGIEATIVSRDPDEAGIVEHRARAALEGFLHPLGGGPGGQGWRPGEGIYLADVAAALEAVEGVDYVKELALKVDGARQHDRVAVAAGRVVAAGTISLRLSEE